MKVDKLNHFITYHNIQEIKISALFDILTSCGSPVDLTIIFSFKKYDERLLKKIKSLCSYFKKINVKVDYIINAFNVNFNDDDFELFNTIDAYLNKIDKSFLYFSSQWRFKYRLDEVKKADKEMDKFIDKLKSLDLSPLEKFLYIYTYLGRAYRYKVDEREDNSLGYLHTSRDPVYIINNKGEYIVCSGFANLLAYYCKEVGIVCFAQKIMIKKDDEAHLNNLVYIKDDKYELEGLYIADVTWDEDEEDDASYYTHCLMPLSDNQFLDYKFMTPLEYFYDIDKIDHYVRLPYGLRDYEESLLTQYIDLYKFDEKVSKFKECLNNFSFKKQYDVIVENFKKLGIKETYNYVTEEKLKHLGFDQDTFYLETLYYDEKELKQFYKKFKKFLTTLGEPCGGPFSHEIFQPYLYYGKELDQYALEFRTNEDILPKKLYGKDLIKKYLDNGYFYPGVPIDISTFASALKVVAEKYDDIVDKDLFVKKSLLNSALEADRKFPKESFNTFKELGHILNSYEKIVTTINDLGLVDFILKNK